MTVFGAYSRYYDLLYKDKDYAAEAAYVIGLLKRYAPGAHALLELGSGTGKHAVLFAQQGYSLHGIERSADMLAECLRRRAEQTPEVAARLSFAEGDIRTFQDAATYDAALSLFHVVSYLTTNADLQAVFQKAAERLKPGGLFLFDIWYGPAVLHLKPETRVKRLEDDRIKVVRLAEPEIHLDRNCIDVKYQVMIRDKNSGELSELHETHNMRYLFTPEIELLLEQAGMELVRHEEWLTAADPGEATWGVCYVARRRDARQ